MSPLGTQCLHERRNLQHLGSIHLISRHHFRLAPNLISTKQMLRANSQSFSYCF